MFSYLVSLCLPTFVFWTLFVTCFVLWFGIVLLGVGYLVCLGYVVMVWVLFVGLDGSLLAV